MFFSVAPAGACAAGFHMTHGGTVGYYLSRFHRYTTMRSGHQGGGIAATQVFMQRRLNRVDIFISKNG